MKEKKLISIYRTKIKNSEIFIIIANLDGLITRRRIILIWNKIKTCFYIFCWVSLMWFIYKTIIIDKLVGKKRKKPACLIKQSPFFFYLLFAWFKHALIIFCCVGNKIVGLITRGNHIGEFLAYHTRIFSLVRIHFSVIDL
jgi:hypothetical protein